MNDTTQVERRGIGFLGLLTIVFVILKALGYLAWSWWWVFAPLWLPLAFIAGIAALVGAIYLVLMVYNEYELRVLRRKRSRK